MPRRPRLLLCATLLALTGCAPASTPAQPSGAPADALPERLAAATEARTSAPRVEVAPDLLADARDPFQHVVDEAELLPPGDCISRDVKLCRLSLDELRLIGVVHGTDGPYAMVVDAGQRGTTLRRGMYVGRPEVLRTPRGMYTAHWRVARIEPGRSRQTADGEYVEDHAAVVFERIDPLNEAAPPVERRVVASRGG